MSQVTLLILIFIILALLLRLDIVFYIVYVIAGIYFLARWMTPRAFRALKMDRQFADHAFLGERVEVTLRLHNQKRLPLPWLQLDESVAPELAGGPAPRFAVSLRGRESREFHYAVQAIRRGYYRLGPLTVRTGDLFGWSELRAQAPASYLTVYPRITPLARLGLPRPPFGTIASQRRHLKIRPAGRRARVPSRRQHAPDQLEGQRSQRQPSGQDAAAGHLLTLHPAEPEPRRLQRRDPLQRAGGPSRLPRRWQPTSSSSSRRWAGDERARPVAVDGTGAGRGHAV